MAVKKKSTPKKKWIQAANIKKGGLHKALGISSSKKIPVKKIKKAAKAGGKLGRMGRLAETFRKIRLKSKKRK